jgi:hypothetical protein
MMEDREVTALVARLGPAMAGHSPEIQGVALARLLSTWLAGHVWMDDAGHIDANVTHRKRTDLLNMHIGHVRDLIGPEHERIHGSRVGV